MTAFVIILLPVICQKSGSQILISVKITYRLIKKTHTLMGTISVSDSVKLGESAQEYSLMTGSQVVLSLLICSHALITVALNISHGHISSCIHLQNHPSLGFPDWDYPTAYRAKGTQAAQDSCSSGYYDPWSYISQAVMLLPRGSWGKGLSSC